MIHYEWLERLALSRNSLPYLVEVVFAHSQAHLQGIDGVTKDIIFDFVQGILVELASTSPFISWTESEIKVEVKSMYENTTLA